MNRYILIAIGGGLGSMLRYFMQAQAAQRYSSRFPVGTLTVNIIACFFIGITLEYLDRHTAISPHWRFLIATGFIGGFSTFSTFEWEAWSDISSGAFWIGILYIVVSIIAGFAAVALGATTARAIR